MSDDPEWFAPKRYGLGAGLPIAWQGWAAIALFVGGIALAGLFLRGYPVAQFSVVITLAALFIILAARTTRGGWRWRWGKDDDEG